MPESVEFFKQLMSVPLLYDSLKTVWIKFNDNFLRRNYDSREGAATGEQEDEASYLDKEWYKEFKQLVKLFLQKLKSKNIETEIVSTTAYFDPSLLSEESFTLQVRSEDIFNPESGEAKIDSSSSLLTLLKSGKQDIDLSVDCSFWDIGVYDDSEVKQMFESLKDSKKPPILPVLNTGGRRYRRHIFEKPGCIFASLSEEITCEVERITIYDDTNVSHHQVSFPWSMCKLPSLKILELSLQNLGKCPPIPTPIYSFSSLMPSVKLVINVFLTSDTWEIVNYEWQPDLVSSYYTEVRSHMKNVIDSGAEVIINLELNALEWQFLFKDLATELVNLLSTASTAKITFAVQTEYLSQLTEVWISKMLHYTVVPTSQKNWLLVKGSFSDYESINSFMGALDFYPEMDRRPYYLEVDYGD